MPIQPQFRHFYGIEWQTVTRPRILERAKNCCEVCRVPNHTRVKRCSGGLWLDISVRWASTVRESIQKIWRDEKGRAVKKPRGSRVRIVDIVLAIAHKNHTPGDDRDENLFAACQWCHLKHDREKHRRSREERKDSDRPILVAIAEAKETPEDGTTATAAA